MLTRPKKLSEIPKQIFKKNCIVETEFFIKQVPLLHIFTFHY